MRFFLLVLVLLGTAAVVTFAMFTTLYYVLSPSCTPKVGRRVAYRWLFVLRRLSASSTSARALAPAATFSCWISR